MLSSHFAFKAHFLSSTCTVCLEEVSKFYIASMEDPMLFFLTWCQMEIWSLDIKFVCKDSPHENLENSNILFINILTVQLRARKMLKKLPAILLAMCSKSFQNLVIILLTLKTREERKNYTGGTFPVSLSVQMGKYGTMWP